MGNRFHSVTLDTDACKGCINCIKRCPTEAIRVRDGKAHIITERCIDCGECIRVCPNHAKKAVYDSLSIIDDYEYTIALPAPSLYGQFNNLDDKEIVLDALLKMGFDAVYEVAAAAEIVSDATRKLMKQGALKLPVISSACPAVVRLIRVRFHELIPNILPLHAPIELAARIAKKKAANLTGLPMEKIGAIFISPCPAKVSAIRYPLGAQKSYVDGAVAMSEVYPRLIHLMKELEDEDQSDKVVDAGRIGVGWASSGGEAAALINENYLAAVGIEHVIKVLEDLEDERFSGLEFVELNACSGGCVGGVLTVENPYIAKAKLKRLRKYLPVSCNHLRDERMSKLEWDAPLDKSNALQLDQDMNKAMEKLNEMEEIVSRLHGLDCGSCGAPSCMALAEDVVRGFAQEEDCIFNMKEQMEEFLEQMADQKSYIEPPFTIKKGREEKE